MSDTNELESLSTLSFKNNIAKDKSISPARSMLFFFVISILYLILNIYNIISCTSIETIVENSNKNIFIIAYVIILIIGMFFINLNISKNLCNSDSLNYNNIFFITFMPWLLVFGILYFILEILDGWVRPFSNTIGYFIVNLLGVETVLKKMLKTDGDHSVKKAIEKINNNISEFINEFDVNHTNYTDFIKKLQAENITNSSAINLNDVGENEIELFKFVNIKHLIGKVVWYFLAGTVISAISYNNIINQECGKTQDEMNKNIDDFYDENADDETS